MSNQLLSNTLYSMFLGPLLAMQANPNVNVNNSKINVGSAEPPPQVSQVTAAGAAELEKTTADLLNKLKRPARLFKYCSASCKFYLTKKLCVDHNFQNNL